MGDIPGGLVPNVKVETDNPMVAAAIALRDFTNAGYDLSPRLAHVDDGESYDGPFDVVLVSDVIHWLRQPAQAELAAAEHLKILLQ